MATTRALCISALLVGVAQSVRKVGDDELDAMNAGDICNVCSKRHLVELAAVGRDIEEWQAAVLQAGDVNGSFLEASMDLGNIDDMSSTVERPLWPRHWNNKLTKTATVIGAGAFGKVYIGTVECDGTKVAIKRLSAALTSKKDMVKEIALLKSFSAWPQFTAYFSDGIGQDKNYYIMMEAALGTDMSKIISKRKHATWQDKNQLFLDLVEGVAQMHAMGIVHRDLKPANVMITRHCSDAVPCHAKVGDLGLACSVVNPSKVHGVSTCSKGLAGTPLYIAPESYKQSSIDLKNDVWALGLILYELQFHRLPPSIASASSLASLQQAVTSLSLTSDPNIRSIQGTMKTLLTGMLVQDHTKRFNAAQVLGFARFLVQEPTISPISELPSCYSGGKPTKPQSNVQDLADVQEIDRGGAIDYFVIKNPKQNIAMNYFFPQGGGYRDTGFADAKTGVVKKTITNDQYKTYDITKMLEMCKKKGYLDTDLRPGDRIISVNDIPWPLSLTNKLKLKDGLLGDLVFKYLKNF